MEDWKLKARTVVKLYRKRSVLLYVMADGKPHIPNGRVFTMEDWKLKARTVVKLYRKRSVLLYVMADGKPHIQNGQVFTLRGTINYYFGLL